MLDDLLLRHADNQHVALEDGEQSCSYQELERMGAGVCGALQGRGIGRGSRVAFLLPKGIAAVALLFGVLRAGACYVPLDAKMPLSRRLELLRLARPDAVVADESGVAELAPFWSSATPLLHVHELLASRADARPVVREASDLAYIIFTSGSTGRPKGVMITHANVQALCGTYQDMLQFCAATRFYNLAPLYFDGSVMELFCVLAAGGTLVLGRPFGYPRDLLVALARSRATATMLMSSVVRAVASPISGLGTHDLSALRLLCYGGEVCPTRALRLLKEALPELRLLHGYGPTEVTYAATCLIFDAVPVTREVMPIGRAFPTVEAFVLDEQRRPVPIGEIGELYLGGPQVMAGYWDDPERTRAVLAPPPLELAAKSPLLYRTGDYVHVDADGLLVFEHRKDDLVKVGGNLVSKLEVERALRACAGLVDAFVTTYSDELGNTRLEAAVTTQAASAPDWLQLQRELAQNLPRAMVPSRFRWVDAGSMPCANTGKIDRAALGHV